MMNNSHRKGVWIVPLLSLLLGSCTESSEGDRSRVVAQRAAERPVVQRIDGGAMTTVPDTATTPAPSRSAKVLAVDMSVNKNGAVALKNPRVYYGEPPNNIGNPPMFTAHVLDSLGNTIFTVPLWDPRWTFVWSDEKNRDFVDLADAGTTVVIVPFKPNIATMRVVKGKERVATVDLSAAVASFCATNREDADCRAEQPTRRK